MPHFSCLSHGTQDVRQLARHLMSGSRRPSYKCAKDLGWWMTILDIFVIMSIISQVRSVKTIHVCVRCLLHTESQADTTHVSSRILRIQALQRSWLDVNAGSMQR